MASYKVQGVEDIYNLQFGKNGFKVLDNSYTGNDVFSYLLVVEDCTLNATSLNNKSDDIVSLNLSNGIGLPGEFNNVRLTLGKIIAFY